MVLLILGKKMQVIKLRPKNRSGIQSFAAQQVWAIVVQHEPICWVEIQRFGWSKQVRRLSRLPIQCCNHTTIIEKKCWNDLMAVIEFGPLLPVQCWYESYCQPPCWTSQHCLVGIGEGYVWKIRSKNNASCRENKDQNRPSVTTVFFFQWW